MLRGEFRPGGAEREWCDPEVLRLLRRRSLARLRREVEPVEPAALARFLPDWQGVAPVGERPRRPCAGRPPSSGSPRSSTSSPACRSRPRSWSATSCPARIPGYQPRLLDELGALGEVAWVGRGSLGRDDGRIVLVRPGREALRPAGPPDGSDPPSGPRHEAIREHLAARGASFYRELFAAAAGPRTARCSTRCGTWSGPARSRTTRSRRCAPCAGSGPRAARRRRAAARAG